MTSRRLSWSLDRFALVLAGVIAIGGDIASAAADEPGAKRYSSIERMAPARLKAAHEDVALIQKSRQVLSPFSGLNDYRAILHAHAEDSAHTGGTRPEMLADARKVGVSVILLSNHFRPPTDFITDSWRGLHEGVLFIPGSEDRGYLLLPTRSIVAHMKDPTPSFIETVTADGGLILLSHIEERPGHSMAGLTGMEIYNRHADAKKDTAGLLAIALKLTHPGTVKELEESLRLYPDELLASQVEYPAGYLAKWDAETASRRLTGVAANDCHHNQILMVKMVDGDSVLVGTNVDRDDQMRKFTATLRPGIRALTRGHQPGDVLARLDFDPYYRSFQNVSTHIFAPELTEAAIRTALRDGHAYVSHDWMCDPSGFRFELIAAGPSDAGQKPGSPVVMGDEVKFAPGQKVSARFPVMCHMRLLKGGKLISENRGQSMEFTVDSPGVYRVEGWLDVGGERRPVALFQSDLCAITAVETLAIRVLVRNNGSTPKWTVRTTEDRKAMSSAVVDNVVAVEETEAYQELMTRVGRRTGKIPAELMVRHVLACVPPHEWPTRVEAMDAVLRRLEAARKDSLRVEARPAEGRHLGVYVTRRPGAGSRPYRTILHGVNPVAGRCDCPDFIKNSLGLCKHILVVLDHLHSRPRVLQQAHKEQEWSDQESESGLRWDPVRPLTGLGDWLDRVVWNGLVESTGARSARVTQALKWFRSSKSGVATLKNSYSDKPARRLELIEDLLKVMPAASENGTLHDPALRALLETERKRLRPLVEASFSGAEVRVAFRDMKRPLYPYQREGVERFLAAGRLLLADDMGLGKTAQAITCCDVLKRTGRIRRGLIIAPASLKPQWAREWQVFSDLPVQVVDGSPDERQAAYARRKEGFLIINYEQLLRDLEIVKHWDPELVVLDEAQRIKNWATKTALSVKGLSPRYRLVLTGTPMENRIEELASIVEWVDDMALEPKWRLNSLHATRADGHREVIGARNLDTIRDRLRHCMVRRIRQDVLDQLPSRTDTRVPIEMTAAQVEEHDALIQPIIALVKKSLRRPLTQAEFLKLMQLLTTQRIISNGLAQLEFEDLWPTIRDRPPEENLLKSLSTPKLFELRQLVRQLVVEQGRKVVVFSQWRRMLNLAHWGVSDLLGEENLRAGFFTGAEGQRRRTQNIVEFHDDPGFRMLFTSDAGGVGLNLQRAANCVVNLELPWNPAVLEQRIGRIYRIGQKLPIDVYNLVCEYGIESRIAALVGSKQAFFKGLFDGDSDTVDFGQASNFLAKVQKLYEPAAVEAVAATGNMADEDADLADTHLDDEVDDPFEEMIEAADESRDPAAPLSNNGDATAAPVPFEPRPLESSGEPVGVTSAVAAMPSSSEVREFFSQLQVRREVSGKVVIEAPAEAASTLGALFEGMAALLQSVAKPRG